MKVVNQTKVDTNHTEYTLQCIDCGATYKVTVLDCAMDDWTSGRKKIQDALPDLTPAQRELFISGMCEGCFMKLFATEEEEDED